PRLCKHSVQSKPAVHLQIASKNPAITNRTLAHRCSGAPYGGRVWGDAEKAINTLKAKAAVLDANAIINTKCSAAPLVNNCWAAKVCSGTAVKW
ncbi:MAG: heavy metal-binding domain-containing protein, partial [Alkalimonas sp.]|nr:heavy metal-binding domain-containing protein [Alkalimonas sp.]